MRGPLPRMRLARFVHRAGCCALLAGAAAAQDAIGVTFAGQVLRLDTVTGAVTVLANGLPNKNGLAYDSENRLWTVVKPSPVLAQFRLARIDPFTGAETIPFPAVDCGDLRALSARNGGGLFAIRNGSATDELVRIDTDTGAVTVIGPTTHGAIQGLDGNFIALMAWDVSVGQVQVNTFTGATQDLAPNSVDPPGLQYMARDQLDERTYVGRGDLYRLDMTTHVATFHVAFAGNPDLRGLEFTKARGEPFGVGCIGVGGPDFIQLGTCAGLQVGVVSQHHPSFAPCVKILGGSDDVWNGVPLPFDVDPLLGTSGCALYVSADLALAGTATSIGTVVTNFTVPPQFAFVQFYVQHVTLEPVPGGLAFTRGLRVRSALP